MGRRGVGVASGAWRRSTTWNPARSNIDSGPVVDVGRGRPRRRRPRRPDRPPAVVAPWSRAKVTAASSNPLATPWPRDRRPTTKHTIDHTGVSSSGGEDLGEGQPLVVLARPDADPPDGFARVVVGDEPGRPAVAGVVVRGALQDGPVLRRGRVGPVAAADPEVGAPAPLRVAALLEERGKVGQAIRGQRLDVERHGHASRHGQRLRNLHGGPVDVGTGPAGTGRSGVADGMCIGRVTNRALPPTLVERGAVTPSRASRRWSASSSALRVPDVGAVPPR